MDPRSRSRISARLAVVLAIAASLLTACFNGGGFHNQGTISGGGRFALVIEPARTTVEGTHFLVDTATGDLWRLDSSAGEASWKRVSDAPPDVAELEKPHFIGGPAEEG